MYLMKAPRVCIPYLDIDLIKIREDSRIYEKLGNIIYRDEFLEDVGYWRKANAIHDWMVRNVQDCNDNCDRYEVSEEKLESLLSICKTVLRESVLVDAMVENGYTYEDGKKVPILEKGKIIENYHTAETLLPTTEGFFFGSTNYDQYYIADIDSTIEIIEQVLESTDFQTEAIFYQSSW